MKSLAWAASVLLGALAVAGSASAAARCVPPSLPPFSAWLAYDTRLSTVETADGGARPMVLRKYRAEPVIVGAWWVDGQLAAVDVNLFRPRRSVWVDRGLLGLDQRLLPNGRAMCRWQKTTGEENPY